LSAAREPERRCGLLAREPFEVAEHEHFTVVVGQRFEGVLQGHPVGPCRNERLWIVAVVPSPSRSHPKIEERRLLRDDQRLAPHPSTRGVARNGQQPRPRRTVGAESLPGSPCREKGFLQHVVGVGVPTGDHPREAVDGGAMQRQQTEKRAAVARAERLDQGLLCFFVLIGHVEKPTTV
jgi:hypothetical protein